MARTGEIAEGAKGISAFIVDATLPGISLGKKDKKMGQRGTSTSDVIFDNVRVSKDCLIGAEGQGFKTAMKVLDRGRLQISAVAVGAAKRLIDESVSYANDRKQFGKSIGEFQLIQAMIADSYADCFAGEAMTLKAAQEFDLGHRENKMTSACKLFCTEMVGRIADRAVQIHGGSGYISEFPVEHFFRDVRLFRLYEGTSQIQQLIIARDLLNESQSAA